MQAFLRRNLSGEDISGKYLDLDDYKGKWIYVDFWASWCNLVCASFLPWWR